MEVATMNILLRVFFPFTRASALSSLWEKVTVCKGAIILDLVTWLKNEEEEEKGDVEDWLDVEGVYGAEGLSEGKA